MSKPVVYLGPSLPLEEARGILDADYRPPVKRGDLTGLQGVEVVAIIDGVFLQNCSVGHREILSLLRQGVKVVGGGSMGALRAAELRTFGMVGVGKIFEMYSKGEIQGDDEVALVFDPESMEPLSEPMVNLRVLLDRASKDNIIDEGRRQRMLSGLRELYYPRRSIPALLEIARRELGEEGAKGFFDYFSANYRDIKKEDAITVLQSLLH